MRASGLFFVVTLSLAILHGCLDRENAPSFVLNGINSIQISTDITTYIQTKTSTSTEIQLDIRYFDEDGKQLPFDSDDINIETYINGELGSEIDISQADTYDIMVLLPAGVEIESNNIQVNVIPLEQAVEQILVSFKQAKSTYTKFEDTLDFVEYLNTQILDTLGTTHNLDPEFHVFDLVVDNQTIANRKLEEFPNGVSGLHVEMGGKSSNELEVLVYDPTTGIKEIVLTLAEATANPYTMAGASTYDFEYQAIDFEDNPINLTDIQLKVGGKTFNSLSNIPIDSVGEISVQLVSFGVRSNIVTIFSREDSPLDQEFLPLIFHIVHNGDPVGTTQNRSATDIQQELSLVNAAFDNTLTTAGEKDQNAVNSYLEFKLATTDPDGLLLAEPGINRVQIQQDIFNTSISTDGVTQFMFDNIWDPNQYINVFVMNTDGSFSFAYFPVLFNATLEGVNTVTDPDQELTFPYAVMLKNAHFNTLNSVLAHELGHMLALFHTWVAPEENSCFNSDFVNDTQDYINSPSFIAGKTRFDCSNLQFSSTNYMDYNSGDYNTFTYDQRERMRTVYDNALFFPKNVINGRTSGFRKGQLDLNIRPVLCDHPH